jgi:hypothetical protein
MRLVVIALAVGLGIGLGLTVRLATAPAAPARAEPDPRFPDPGGRHWRIDTAHGTVHVWAPPGYRAEKAGVAVYVHGYYTDVDDAWDEHHLAAQFAASGCNALFIVPEAPRGNRHEVYWPSLGDLLREVRRHTGLVMPWGGHEPGPGPGDGIVALGHSGAYRTLLEWLDERQLGHIVLLDGLYGNEQPFLDWLASSQPRGAHRGHRLTIVGLDTLRWSELVASEQPGAYGLDWIPDQLADVPEAARAARLVHVRSQYAHMELVTEGKAIPVLLRMSGLPALAPARQDAAGKAGAGKAGAGKAGAGKAGAGKAGHGEAAP